MNHFKTLLKISFLFCFLLSSTAHGKLDRFLSPEEISLLEKNIKTNPENLKSRLFLADHYSQKKNWSMVEKWLTPVTERLFGKFVDQLIEAHVQLSHFQEAIPLVDDLLNRKKVKTRTYLLAIKVYSGFLASTSNTSFLVKLESPEIGSKKAIGKGTKKAKKDQQDQYKVEYKVKAEVAREKIFELLKQAQNKNPENVKIYDLWLEMLEKHIPNYANEARRVFEDMEANKVKLRKRHYSKLCKYNSLANFIVEAKEICQEAVNRVPGNPDNYIYLGRAHIDTGEKERGQRILASVGKKFSQSEEALWVTASTYYENKNIVSAYTYYLKASRHKKAKPRDFLGLAKTAFELKKYEVSLKAFREHCQRSNFLHQEFRRASGLLKKNSFWQERFRQKMQNCKSKSGSKGPFIPQTFAAR